MKHYGSIAISLASAVMLCLVATAAFATAYDTVTENLGPVSYWRFEEANGDSQAVPTVGTAPLQYDWAAAKVSAAGIDGSSGVLIGSAGNARLGGVWSGMPAENLGPFNPHSFTIEYWVNPIDNTAGFNAGTSFFAGTSTLSYFQSGGLQNGYFGLSTGDGATPAVWIQYGGVVPNGQWSMLTATFTETDPGTSGPNTAAGDLRFYVNGQLQELYLYGTVDEGTVYHETGLTNYADRADWGGIAQFFSTQSAAVDNLAIFDFALSQNQLLGQFDAAIPEPGMLSLLAIGGAFMVWRRKVVAKRA